MKIYVLGSKISYDTVNFLGSVSPLITPIFDYDYNELFLPDDVDVFFRYGSSLPLMVEEQSQSTTINGDRIVKNIYYINTAEAVANSANKIKMRNLFKDSGVSCPKFVFNPLEDEPYSITIDTDMYKRKSNHRRGKDMELFTAGTTVKLLPEEILVEKIDMVDEFRVFVYKNKAIEVDLKVKSEEGEEPSEEDMNRASKKYNGNISKDARNYANGWTFIPIANPPEGLEDEAIKAIGAVGLDFGAVDLCIDKSDNVYVFETNSAPSIKVARKALLLVNCILADILGHAERILAANDIRIGDLIKYTTIRA